MMALTYREPDRERVLELERVTREAEARARSLDAADVNAMRSPWRALRTSLPNQVTRTACAIAVVAIALPIVPTAVVMTWPIPHEDQDHVSMIVFIVGAALGIAGLAFGIRAIVRSPRTERFMAVVATFASFCAVFESLVCALIISVMPYR